MKSRRVAHDVAPLDTGISRRAGEFLTVNHAGPHATKRIARVFSVSAAMAKRLRAGRSWTVARLDQAARIYGRAFSSYVWPPSANETQRRLDRIEALLAEIRNDLRREK